MAIIYLEMISIDNTQATGLCKTCWQ